MGITDDSKNFDIQRVLWLEDNPNTDWEVYQSLKDEDEIMTVKLMDDVFDYIRNPETRNKFDTVVLDIDMSQGILSADQICKNLTDNKLLYLSEEQLNSSYLKSCGGYLVYIYLLKKGYPSEQIVFLTGNAGSIASIKALESTKIRCRFKTVEEYTDAFIEACFNASQQQFLPCLINGHKKKKKATDRFVKDCEARGIDSEVSKDESLQKHALSKERDEIDKRLKKYVATDVGQSQTAMQESVDDFASKIKKFHDANMEFPTCYEKGGVGYGTLLRGSKDFNKWMNNSTRSRKILRWLVLNLCKIMGDYFITYIRTADSNDDGEYPCIYNDSLQNRRNEKIKRIDVQIAFKELEQAFATYYSSNSGDKRRNKTAIHTLVVPLDKYQKRDNKYVNLAHQIRNFTAHNHMGESFSDEQFMFLLLIIVECYKPYREAKAVKKISDWKKRALEFLLEEFKRNNNNADISAFPKIDQSVYNSLHPFTEKDRTPLDMFLDMGDINNKFKNKGNENSRLAGNIKKCNSDYYFFILYTYLAIENVIGDLEQIPDNLSANTYQYTPSNDPDEDILVRYAITKCYKECKNVL